MVGSPGVMAGKVRVLPNRPGGSGGFARPSAADEDRHAAQINKDLRGATRHRIRGDRGAKHLDVPIGRRFRIFADDVDVIEFERWITHRLPLVAIPAARLRDDSVRIERSAAMLPPNDKLAICFAHVAYRMHERFSTLNTGINSFAVRDPETLENRVGEADVLVISGLWHNDLLDRAKNLRFIQAIGAGTDQFPREELARRGIRLASARGVNARAVAEHAMALILALSRRLPEARDNQRAGVWRGMIGDLSRREDELGGKTLLVVGLGQIGGRLAQLAKAFDMRVVGLRRDPAAGRGAADAVHTMSELKTLLPAADIVALTCPLTKETERLIDADALGRMKS